MAKFNVLCHRPKIKQDTCKTNRMSASKIHRLQVLLWTIQQVH